MSDAIGPYQMIDRLGEGGMEIEGRAVSDGSGDTPARHARTR